MILGNVVASFAINQFCWIARLSQLWEDKMNMQGRRILRAGFFAAIVWLGGGLASAQQAATQMAEGVWTRDDGAARIQFSSCGAALCGAIVWLKNASSKAHVGQQVFFDMTRADQNSWTGKAFNPEDGKTYSGKMVLTGKKLKTSGCMLGGLICKTVLWRRGG
jgi:uncharacterized protein (DUF2147 family)